MSLLIWENKYTVGIRKLDDQHKKLIELINHLYDAMRQGHGKDVLKNVLNDLFEYTKYHFDTEEKYFAQFNYENKDKHIKEHDDLRNKVIDLKEKVDTGKVVISNDILSFLKQWLVSHIMDIDKQYGQFLNEKGVF